MALIKDANLLIRFLLELCALAALGHWGFRVGKRLWEKLALSVGLPIVAAFIWATFVAPDASVFVMDWLRILLEFTVLGSAAAALFFSRHPKLCFLFVVAVLLNRMLMTIWGQ